MASLEAEEDLRRGTDGLLERLSALARGSGRAVRRLLLRRWVRPLDRLMLSPTVHHPGLGWRGVRELLLHLRCIGLLVANSPVLKVVRLRGRRWTVVYVGEGDSVEELRYALFEAPPVVEEAVHIPLWRAPRAVRRGLGEGDLVVCELNRLIPWRPQARHAFSSPPVVRQVTELTVPPPVLRAGLKRQLRRCVERVEEQGFTYEASRREEDFELFYNHMYLPFVRSRHGERAVLTSRSLAYAYFRHGELLFVLRDGQRVGGVLVHRPGDEYVALLAGISESYLQEAREGISIALYWSVVCRAWELGLRRIDWGRSRSRTSDGVFTFKRRWQARPEPVPELHLRRLFLADRLPPTLRRYLNERGLLAEQGGRFWRVLFAGEDAGIDREERRRMERRAKAEGLAGLLVLGPSDEEVGDGPASGGR